MFRIMLVPIAAWLLAATTLDAQSLSAARASEARAAAPGRKSPTAARIIGIVPGAGHMYAGETGRGFAYIGGLLGVLVVGTAAFAGECVDDIATGAQECDGSPVLENAVTLAFWGLYGWSIYDAGRAARRANARRGLRTALFVAPSRGGDRRAALLGVSLAAR